MGGRGSTGVGRKRGFTLIEVIAGVFLTAIVMSVAFSIYVGISRNTERANATIRQTRSGMTILDRLARDLQTAFLVVKPEGKDWFDHGWLFRAESETASEGADRVRFISHKPRRRSSEGHSSDFATISYMLEESPEGRGMELLRMVEPNVPDSQRRDFPYSNEEGVVMMADGIQSLGMHFLGAGGDWVDNWDSTLLTQSNELPIAVELELVMLPEDIDANDPFAFVDEDDLPVRRRVVTLPMRPIEIPTNTASEDGDSECALTVSGCLAKQSEETLDALDEGCAFDSSADGASYCSHMEDAGACWEDVSHLFADSGVLISGCEGGLDSGELGGEAPGSG